MAANPPVQLEPRLPQSKENFDKTVEPAADKSTQQKEKISDIETLLHHVFNAAPYEVKKFFATTKNVNPSIVLQKAAHQEGYTSQSTKKFVCIRRWKEVSPLQAAVLCGDFFLAHQLLSYIKNDDALQVQAIKQLQEILSRIKISIRMLDKSIKEYGFQVFAQLFNQDGALEKVDENNFADSAEFLSPLKETFLRTEEFLAAIQSYLIGEGDERVIDLRKISSEKEADRLKKLWGRVGECQKRLPRYLLQRFCDIIDFYFWWIEPKRGPCLVGDFHQILNLDTIGMETSRGLYRGFECKRLPQAVSLGDDPIYAQFVQEDSRCMVLFCIEHEQRLKEMIENLIKRVAEQSKGKSEEAHAKAENAGISASEAEVVDPDPPEAAMIFSVVGTIVSSARSTTFVGSVLSGTNYKKFVMG